MPSLRKRVSSYFRQLSFHNEPRDKRHNTVNENTFVTKYLEGHVSLKEGSPIIYGKNPTDLPNYELGSYESGPSSVIGCYSGPNGGLTTVKRIEKHLSVLDADIDFIDTFDEEPVAAPLPLKSPVVKHPGRPIDNTTMVIKVAGHEYCVTNRPRRHSKSHSLGSISDFGVQIEKTKIDKSFYCNDNNNCEAVECRNGSKIGAAKRNSDIVVTKGKDERKSVSIEGRQRKCDSNATSRAKRESYALAKSKSEGNPFHHKKRGRIIKIDRPNIREQNAESRLTEEDEQDSALPGEWNRKSDHFYGISDSLYDRNQVTRHKNGDPIADCFGIIARNDSAILAVADGVNWGEKASIAAKSAVHGSLHYLNKTIFNDTKPFEGLTIKTDESSLSGDFEGSNLISNTREVFVCLLRAFNCAHDLILENEGMLTTLTVAVVLPLKHKLERRYRGPGGEERVQRETQYVCCVCNVGDTLAYVYSQKIGMRELTKGSHDINCNRDMRDALGALGPVDGINPELSNLTISVTTLQKGDIVLVASDGLTDNFDPNVCKFAVNTADQATKAKRPAASANVQNVQIPVKREEARAQAQRPPVKPPRRSKEPGRGSVDRSSVTPESVTLDEEVKSPVEADVPVDMDNPLVAHFVRENSVEENSKGEKEPIKKPSVVENKASSLRRQASSQTKTEPISAPSHNSLKHQKSASRTHIVNNPSKKSEVGYKFLRSRTTIDMRTTTKPIFRNEDGIPYITPVQRYELQLLLMEDILKNGISGKDPPCTTARKLCENLVSYTVSITAAKRRTLEDQDLYYDNRNGVLVEVSGMEKKIRRKKGLEKVQGLPGKLDHVTVVAYNVGNCDA